MLRASSKTNAASVSPFNTLRTAWSCPVTVTNLQSFGTFNPFSSSSATGKTYPAEEVGF